MKILKQSTAAHIMFGPFVDKGDGVTLEVAAGIITSIDHATTGIFLSKNGAAGAIRHQGVTASVLDAYGMFQVHLDTTDTDTVGNLRVMMAEAATFLPVHDDYVVLPANVYDSLMGTDLLDVSVTQIGGVAQSATDLKDFADTGYDPTTHKVQGLVLADTCTTNSDMKGTDSAALASVLGAAVGASISADIAAVKAQTVAIEADTDVIDDATSGLVKIASDVAAILVDTDVIDDGTSGLVKIAQDVAATLVDTAVIGALGAGLTALATQASVDALADAPDLTGEVTALQTDLDTLLDTDLPAVKVDTAAVKVQTDKLQFTVARHVDSNLQYVNDVALVGDGGATPWGPA